MIVLAAAAEAADCTPPATVPDRASFVWLAPAGRRAAAGRELDLIRTSDVRAWASEQGALATVGGLLRWAGERKRAKEPKRPWIVVVFDIETAGLCRPVSEVVAAGGPVAGLPACEHPGPIGRDADGGCGWRLTSEGTQGPDAFRLTWRDAVGAGFCVLPMDRFLSGT